MFEQMSFGRGESCGGFENIHERDIAWLAGLFDADGCFTIVRGRRNPSPVAKVKMTDLDTVRRAAGLMGANIHEEPRQKPHYKLQYRASLTAGRARDLMNALYPYMSARRQERIDEILREVDWHRENP